jgi:hypothetical protein
MTSTGGAAVMTPHEFEKSVIRLTPELREWLLKQHSEKEIADGFREAREQGGPELGTLIQEFEQELRNRELRPQS